nr:8-amino-7-oxononanoate synthase [uncultured Flavobacterium sp.]
MDSSYSFKIFDNTALLPLNWDNLASTTVFLSKKYLQVLENACPTNMQCHFIGIFNQDDLIGIAISQFIDLNALDSFGERDNSIKNKLRNFVFKKIASHVLIIGNNMLTGQNSFSLSSNANPAKAIQKLHEAVQELKNKFAKKDIKIHITSFKDYNSKEFELFRIPAFRKDFKFSTQPNMIFTIDENWHHEEDYISSLSKKYRDQYKRGRKRATGIEKRKLPLEEIIALEDTIYELYLYVAKNAPFNTFFLPKNHFSVFKELFKDKFLFYGYFLNGKLIGFNTLIKNGSIMDTYFLGYDETIQREKMLYLNMLYDMIAYSINKKFKSIVFARTALEIKSSVGAKPEKVFGLMRHESYLFNLLLPKVFRYLEPETIWQERNPFK